MYKTIEELLAYHCGPALIGIKAANLVSCAKEKYPELPRLIEDYNQALNRDGLYFKILCQCQRRYLLFVYRQNLLTQSLSQAQAQLLLEKAGYPLEAELSAQLSYLGGRIGQSCDFPHEIGVFLGYPIADVLGFIQYGGRNYKLNGYWKVYSDPLEAQNMFRRYDQCRNLLCQLAAQGLTLQQLLQTAA